MRSLTFTAGLVLLSVSASAALAGEASPVEGVSLTVYNDNLALIREQRSFELDNGTQTLVLSDVSGQLQPQTVHLDVTNGPELSLVEQNYDYDLLDSSKLLQKFIGQTILLVDDYARTQTEAKLLSVNSGTIVEVNGQILLNPPGRIVLPASAAADLLLKPTLSWMVWSPQAAKAKAEISYLSGGLSWNADYVLMLSPDDKLGDIEGWVTMSNYSGTTYKDAALKLVAGDVNRVRDEMKYDAVYRQAPAPMAAEAAPPGGFQEESMFEYHLYDLQRPTTIKNNQQKQIGLLTAGGVPVTKRFLFDGRNGGDVHVSVEFKNEEDHGMGMPLPAGVVRVFKKDSKGQAQFVGENRIKHTPRKDDVRLTIGNAFDIKGETARKDYKDLAKGYEETYTVKLKNRKLTEDVVVTVEHSIWGDWTMLESSLPYKKKDANTAQFEVPVKADSEVELTYNYRVEWK
jgi:hypothetical protein